MINWETLKISDRKIAKKREIINFFIAFIFCFIIIVALSWFVYMLSFSVFAFGETNINNILKIFIPLFIILFFVTCLVAYGHLNEKSYNMCVELNIPNKYDIKNIFSNPGPLLKKINTKVDGDTFVMCISTLTAYSFYSKFKNPRIVFKNDKAYFDAKMLYQDFYAYYFGKDDSLNNGYKNSDDFKNDLEKNLKLALEKLLEFKSMDELVLNSIIK